MDPVITIRNDRYVVPVKEEYRNKTLGGLLGQISGFLSGYEFVWDLADEGIAITGDFTIEIYRLPSKNYSGKSFLTCSLQ